MISADILIIGSGITGTALARELSQFESSVIVIDRGADIAEGATKANSGIIHAGYDALPGTNKARFNVEGASLYASLAKELGVPYKKCGAYVIGFDGDDQSVLQKLLDRGIQNGVKNLRILTRDEILEKEPLINPEVSCALDVPDSAIISPYEMAFALADDAALNGVDFFFGQSVNNVYSSDDGKWIIETDTGNQYACRVLVNCSGSSGAEIHNIITGESLKMTHRRGEYYLLDRTDKLPFTHTIFQCPSSMGKGVLVSPTVHGNLLIGPNAEDILNEDTSTTAAGLAEVLSKALKTWPDLSIRTNITNFSGIRAHIDSDDFIIGPVKNAPGVFEAIGIESPGLSSAPAIARELSSEIAGFLRLHKKEKKVLYIPPRKSFREMDENEKEIAVRNNPGYGNIVCRCETVTEAEVLEAIRRPVGARTIDGVKRRTRAGMGRCQGGFCSPRVAQLLAEELQIPVTEITKNGGKSQILFGTVESFLKGGCDHE